MSISGEINDLTTARNTIRSKMVGAGQATGNEKLATLAENLDIGDYIEKKSSLPTASSTLEGAIYMYTGATSGGLTTGYFYKCIEDPEDAGEYIWQQLDVQPGSSEINNVKAFIGIEIASSQLAVGATSVTFSNANILSTSQLTLYSDNSSNTPIFWNTVSVTNGVSATYTFPALTVATTFYLQIVNAFQNSL